MFFVFGVARTKQWTGMDGNGREWTSLRRRVGLALHSILISGMQNRRNNTSSSVCPALPVKESLTPELSGQWSERSDIRYYANRSSFTRGVSSIRVNQMVREMSRESKGSVVLRMKVE